MEPQEVDKEWKVKDKKTFAIIATMLSVNLQTMIRSAISSDKVWEIFNNIFLQQNTHNWIQMRRKVHDLKWANSLNMYIGASHQISWICWSMNSMSDGKDQYEQLIVWLSSLSADYDSIVESIKNISSMDMMWRKEMIHLEYGSLQLKESDELVLKIKFF